MRSVAHCRKWIAPLLAAAMILCGICLDLGQADIVFSRAVQPAEKTTEAYLARTLVSQQESPCTTEQLGLKSAQALTESGRSSEQNLKVVLGLFLLLLFTVLQIRIRTEKRKNPERALVRRRCIIRYIHRQDGEKWIPVISSIRRKSQEENTYGSEYCGSGSVSHRVMRGHLVLVAGKWKKVINKTLAISPEWEYIKTI